MNIDKLSSEELNELYGLPYYIALLIASADGYVDEAEIKKAIRIISANEHLRSHNELSSYYDIINDDAEDKLKIILAAAPKNPKDRTLYFTRKIAEANILFTKLEKNFVSDLIDSLRNLGKQVAKASGGIFGFGSIGNEELKLLQLIGNN